MIFALFALVLLVGIAAGVLLARWLRPAPPDPAHVRHLKETIRLWESLGWTEKTHPLLGKARKQLKAMR